MGHILHFASAQLSAEKCGCIDVRFNSVDEIIQVHLLLSTWWRRVSTRRTSYICRTCRVKVSISFLVRDSFLFFSIDKTGLNVSGNAEHHVFTKLSDIYRLVALIDNVGIHLFTHFRIDYVLMTNARFKLLPALFRCLLF